MSRNGKYPISVRTTEESPFLPGGLLAGFSPIGPDAPAARSPLARTLVHVLQRGATPAPDCLLGTLGDLSLAAVARIRTEFRIATRASRNTETTCWSEPPQRMALYEAMPPFLPEAAEQIMTGLIEGATLEEAIRREAEVRHGGGLLVSAYTASRDPNRTEGDAQHHAASLLITAKSAATSAYVSVNATKAVRPHT